MDEFLSGAPFTGFLLAAGAACLLGISAPSFMPVWTAPPEVGLPLIARHARAWRVANVAFALAAVLTSIGLWSLPDAVGTGGIALARAAAAAYALAAGLWLVFLAIRIAVTPLKASGYVASGSVDPWYAPLDRLASALFSGFTAERSHRHRAAHDRPLIDLGSHTDGP